MANPLVKIVVPIAGILAAQVGSRAARSGWGAVFGEDAPTVKANRASKKDTAARRKQAKKDGLSKAEIDEIRDPMDEQPVWKVMLWTLISGVMLQGFKQLAQQYAKKGTERVVSRRPRANRG
ncbi:MULTISPECIES: DUF4235 domain-containing protein [Brachybacterium]|uniref:DUF4235 domain-containing protein n=1 Tax=Brachybacterium rhamnosum TaxID=173361 RepID=A0ABW4PST7_9MICO|nr:MULTISPECIES: DUF4235 domain-containing protein [Brachybacterium]MCW1804622.1 DUF4235 domain-containing protein [Brachybacterium squillarum]QCR54618.1 hypothetical protein C1N80_14230 [Brachybacterium sp. SGAir0954]